MARAWRSPAASRAAAGLEDGETEAVASDELSLLVDLDAARMPRAVIAARLAAVVLSCSIACAYASFNEEAPAITASASLGKTRKTVRAWERAAPLSCSLISKEPAEPERLVSMLPGKPSRRRSLAAPSSCGADLCSSR
jgi:hypothetical protein